MSYTLHRAAERDLTDAVRFYRQEAGRAVAGRLLDEFERVAKLLTENPGLGRLPASKGAGSHYMAFHTPSSIAHSILKYGSWLFATRTVIPNTANTDVDRAESRKVG